VNASAGNRDTHILVIDDDREVSEIIRWVLENEGWSTDAAWDGEQGVAKATDREPSLVVLDMSLPKLSGDMVANHLHALYDDIPILVVTANGTASASAQKACAFGYLTKPFDLDALVSSVRTGLTSGRAIQHSLNSAIGSG
jgi:DNA-binding response OmpR family regulator